MNRDYFKGAGVFILLLSGCTFTPYNTNFDCPIEKGVSCTRMSEINRMIDRGEISEETDKNISRLSCNGSCSTKSLSKETSFVYFYKKKSESPKSVSIENQEEFSTFGEKLIQELPEEKRTIQELSIKPSVEEEEI